MSLIAVGIGLVAAYVALGLLELIYFFTQIFFYQRWSTHSVSPAVNHLGWWVLAVPLVGGLMVGLISHYGSEPIRGHGIPGALEAVPLRASRVEARAAVLRPISSA